MRKFFKSPATRLGTALSAFVALVATFGAPLKW